MKDRFLHYKINLNIESMGLRRNDDQKQKHKFINILYHE